MKQNTARPNLTHLATALLLLVFNLTAAVAATPTGTPVYPAFSKLQTAELVGGSPGNVSWTAPKAGTYQLWVQIPASSTSTNATYNVYPKGNAVGNTACSSTDPTYPCFQVTVDQTTASNGWAQLMLNNNVGTSWVFTKAGLVSTNAGGIPNSQLLGVGEVVFASYTPSKLTLGQSYQGGKIAYIDNTGKHGLIAAPYDQSPAYPNGSQWYNGSWITTGATGTAIGTGQANTTAIVKAQGSGSYAAKLCDDLVLGGYSDWYLPSRDELNQLYLNQSVVGGFADLNYWSSSEYGYYSFAWLQYFGNGSQYITNKDRTLAVRAVRAF